jgi:hypothetical protein
MATLLGRDLLAGRPGPLLVAPLGPPGLAVQRPELPNDLRIVEHEEPPRLRVATIGRLDRRLDDQPQVLDRNRIRPELPNRSLTEHRLADRHVQPSDIHPRYLRRRRGWLHRLLLA